jgi:DNA ligase 1
VLDPTGWWFSEKLDGVRAYWDGQMLISRLGNKIHAPDWFLRELPKDGPLDGELWIKRGYFHETNGMVRRQDQNWDIWKQLHFLVFDAPRCNAVFELRLDAASRAIKNSDVARLVHHERLRDLAHLKTELKRVEAMGGEGLMLRQPESFYEAGRSQTLLKVKNFVDDEARILGYNKGSGKFKGMVGSYQCELRSGVAFDVGTGMSNDQRKDPLPIGSIITVHYKELTKDGVPREPTFHGLRIDAKPWGKKKG